MAYEKLPRAEMTIDPTLEDYTAASLMAERLGGSLRPLPIVVLVAAGLLFVGMSSMSWFQTNYSSVFVPLLICFFCPVLIILFFWIQPDILKKRAARNFVTYNALMIPAILRLFADNAVTSTDKLTLTDPYALMKGCIETPELFVLIKDHERMLIIPKRCLTPDKAEEITDFLRLVFARRRRVMKNWVF